MKFTRIHAPSPTPAGVLSRPMGYLAILGTFILATVLAVGVGGLGGPSESASAVETRTIAQCNGVLNADAQRVDCHVTVANTLDIATGVGSSAVKTQICEGAPGTTSCGAILESQYQEVITSVEQCNGSGNKGGSVVNCDVTITNAITGSIAVTAGTVNQCIGSGEDGGELPLNCVPVQATTGATVTQCNGSGNGGGATQRVNCTVGAVTETAALRVTVNQCNGSGNGGGALVTCSASETNVVTPATVTPGGPGTEVPEAPGPEARGPGAGGPDHLPTTGFNGWPLGLYGTVALILGAVLMVRSGRITEGALKD